MNVEQYAFIMAQHYMEAADFTEGGEDNPDIAGAEFSEQACQCAYNTCLMFAKGAWHYLQHWSPEQAGHDLWLTRNGHGTGFWDRKFPYATCLDNRAHTMGPADLYVGDDGLLYFEHI